LGELKDRIPGAGRSHGEKGGVVLETIKYDNGNHQTRSRVYYSDKEALKKAVQEVEWTVFALVFVYRNDDQGDFVVRTSERSANLRPDGPQSNLFFCFSLRASAGSCGLS
jgi:hypothetical protein